MDDPKLRKSGGLVLICALAAVASGARGEAGNGIEVDLAEMSLKRIMELDVTSVGKRTQKLRDVAASVYVIGEEEIRRSGATRLQDLLETAPGLWISEASYTMSSSGIREGANSFSNSVAWVLDGMPITDNITGGVFFNVMDIPLEDIERIEVIKGPGGPVYGANSASGIVSIFTRKGEGAEGILASLAGGTGRYLAPYLRYGWAARDDLFLALWGRLKTHRGYDRNPLFAGDSLWAPLAGGGEARVANRFRGSDDYQMAASGGLKWEYRPDDDRKWSGQVFHAGVADGQYSIRHFPWPDSPPDASQPFPKRPDSIYANRELMRQTMAQARMDAGADPDNAYFLHAYHWHYRYDLALSSGIRTGYDISEIEAQKNATLFDSHRLSAGANARRVQYAFSGIREEGSVFIAHPDRQAFLLGAFLQDEISLGSRWMLTTGAKAEIWTLIGPKPEVSPSLRLAYKPSDDWTWWAALSRSFTTPSYSQSDLEMRQSQIPPEWYLSLNPQYQGPTPAAGRWVALVPGEGTGPVRYYSLEAGHRGSPTLKAQWDLSAFYSWVRGQLGLTPIDPTLQTLIPSRAHPPDSIVPLYYGNLEDYESFGGEGIFRFLPGDGFRLELSYAMFFIHGFEGRKIPGDALQRTYRMPEDHHNRTPNHVGRAKIAYDLYHGIWLGLNGLVSSPFSRGDPFDYAEQVPESREQIPGGALVADPSRPQFQLDVSLHKRLWRDRLALTLWGRNVLADPVVESFNQYGWTSFPHQIHRTFGAGLVYQY